MTQYISKADVVVEIENLLDKGKHHDAYQCAYRDGNNGALYALKNKLDTLEVKEVDLETFDKRVTEMWGRCAANPNDTIACLHIDSFIEIAHHFFELGLNARKEE